MNCNMRANITYEIVRPKVILVTCIVVICFDLYCKDLASVEIYGLCIYISYSSQYISPKKVLIYTSSYLGKFKTTKTRQIKTLDSKQKNRHKLTFQPGLCLDKNDVILMYVYIVYLSELHSNVNMGDEQLISTILRTCYF